MTNAVSRCHAEPEGGADFEVGAAAAGGGGGDAAAVETAPTGFGAGVTAVGSMAAGRLANGRLQMNGAR